MKLTKFEKSFIILFCFILIAEIQTGMSYPLLHYFAKPALLVSIIIFYYKQNTSITNKIKQLTFGALIFSLLGDILLMFADKSDHFFTLGLVAFLTAHILYILVFLKRRNTDKKPYLFNVILLVYGGLLFYFLKDNLGDMLIPVIVYMLVILTMGTTAYLRKGEVPNVSYKLVFVGAILFMISDSLLALNKFYEPLPFSNISIMFTYAFAQLCIIFGLLKER
ncbi:lysoplasmalogenase [Bizionia sp.]|uniref:lysoplasmalogenase n=1 Tax=Bizionia sp. TaxID=1954480 RepID=UPI003A92E68A